MLVKYFWKIQSDTYKKKQFVIFILNAIIIASNCVVPINDIRGVESMGYAKGEKIIRCKLAAVFRLMDLYGWTQGIYNQVSVSIDFYKMFII